MNEEVEQIVNILKLKTSYIVHMEDSFIIKKIITNIYLVN